MRIKAAKVTGLKKVEQVDINLGKPKDNEVLIKVHACGICSTEMAVFNGTTIGVEGVSFHYKSYPANLGHEVVGYVEEVGHCVKKLKVGDCVSGLTYSGCGFAEYIMEPKDVLIKISETDASKHHLYIMEPLMGTTNILHQINICFGDTVTIIGDGFMSMLLVRALAKYPLNELIVVGHHDWRLELIKKYGATCTINSINDNAWQKIMDITNGNGVDISVEYGSSVDALRLAASICKPKVRAKLVMASAYSNDMPFIVANYLQNRAPVITPAYPHHSFNKEKDLARALWGMENGIYPMEELITHQFNFSNINDAFEISARREKGYIKGLFFPE